MRNKNDMAKRKPTNQWAFIFINLFIFVISYLSSRFAKVFIFKDFYLCCFGEVEL